RRAWRSKLPARSGLNLNNISRIKGIAFRRSTNSRSLACRIRERFLLGYLFGFAGFACCIDVFGELKKTPIQITTKGGRNLGQLCEILLRDAAASYKKSRLTQNPEEGKSTVVITGYDFLTLSINDPHDFKRCLELLAELRQGIKDNGFDEERDGLVLNTVYGEANRHHTRRTLPREYSASANTARATEEERVREGYLFVKAMEICPCRDFGLTAVT